VFKTDVVSGFFGLNPFMPENFFALGEKLAIQRRSKQQAAFGAFTHEQICFVVQTHTMETNNLTPPPNGSAPPYSLKTAQQDW
jgi:hypothetical protein